MKKIQKVLLIFFTASILLTYSCKPNDDKNTMDSENSNKEGGIDSTKIPNFDSAHVQDSSHTSISTGNKAIGNLKSKRTVSQVPFFIKKEAFLSKS